MLIALLSAALAAPPDLSPIADVLERKLRSLPPECQALRQDDGTLSSPARTLRLARHAHQAPPALYGVTLIRLTELAQAADRCQGAAEPPLEPPAALSARIRAVACPESQARMFGEATLGARLLRQGELAAAEVAFQAAQRWSGDVCRRPPMDYTAPPPAPTACSCSGALAPAVTALYGDLTADGSLLAEIGFYADMSWAAGTGITPERECPLGCVPVAWGEPAEGSGTPPATPQVGESAFQGQRVGGWVYHLPDQAPSEAALRALAAAAEGCSAGVAERLGEWRPLRAGEEADVCAARAAGAALAGMAWGAVVVYRTDL